VPESFDKVADKLCYILNSVEQNLQDETDTRQKLGDNNA
jgi:hypothetical protein